MQINCTMEQKNLRSGNSFIWSSPCSFDWVFHSPLLAGGKGVTEYHEYCFISSIFRPLQQATAHLILACTRPWLCSWLQRTSHACCLLAGRLLQADSVCHLSESGAWRDRCLQSLSAHEPLPWRVLSPSIYPFQPGRYSRTITCNAVCSLLNPFFALPP
jgi:hypothetical protein